MLPRNVEGISVQIACRQVASCRVSCFLAATKGVVSYVDGQSAPCTSAVVLTTFRVGWMTIGL